MNESLIKHYDDIKKTSDMLYVCLGGQKKTHSEIVTNAKLLLEITMRGATELAEYDDILNAVINMYEIEVGIKTYAPDVISNNPSTNYWLNKVKASIPHAYFDRYKMFLRTQGFSQKAIENIEKTCEETLSYCANPKNASGIDKKKGLVVGDVQSGKTANYLGLINMAYDYGYKIVVLLAGSTKSLRIQTQKRTDSGVIGAKSDSIGNSIEYIGVGLSSEDHYAVPFTNQTNDFAKFIQRNLNATISDYNKPVVLVVKKVKSILESVSERLIGELQQKGIGDTKSILIIDDEADYASVNTAKPEKNPTAINKAIRDIFNKFPISTYVGYTATPFANIFINPSDEDENNLDLFPSDFIVQLHAPDNYFGGRKVFPSDDFIPRCLRIINEEEPNFWPVQHSKSDSFGCLCGSLIEAINSFLVNNVIRTLRGQKNKHRSMMINITRFNDIQEQIRCRVEEYITNLTNAIEQLSNKPVDEFIKNKYCNALYTLFKDKFYASIHLDNEDESSPVITWSEIQNGIYDEIKQVCIAVINSRNGKMTQKSSDNKSVRFDYEDYKTDGARVIAIGGMVLSRGLTLEGLMTSYYSRNAGTYDTLLQMCRWFGYRPKYEDLCRVYLSQDNLDRFDAALCAVEDMKEQFSEMKCQGKKPKDFGLMIKESPDSLNTSLMVTSRNKMRLTETKIYQLNYGGVYADSSKLYKDPSANNSNLKAFLDFYKKNITKFSMINNRFMATKVSKFEISELIRALKIPYVNQKFDTEGLAEYIENSDVFLYWDVVIATGGSNKSLAWIDKERCSDLRSVLRSFHTKTESDLYIRIGGTNNRVLEPGIFNAGLWLTEEQKELILRKKNSMSTKPRSTLSVTDYLAEREHPLLVIYPIDLLTDVSESESIGDEQLKKSIGERKAKIKDSLGEHQLLAFAFGFPKKQSDQKMKYRLNKVKIDELNREALEFDDEDEGEDDNDD